MGRVNEIKIDKFVRQALESILCERGKTKRLSDVTGISKSQLSKFRTGATKSISTADWEKLLPYISKYLPTQQIGNNNSGISVVINQGKINQVNHTADGSIENLMNQIIDNQELSAETKVEMLKILKNEVKTKDSL